MRSQDCWFGEPARMVGIWGKCMGPLLWLTPSLPATGSEATTGLGPGSPGWHRSGEVRCSAPHSAPPASCIRLVCVYREMMLLRVSGGEREGEETFPASASQQEPSLSLANLRPIPHGLSEPRGLCVLRSTQAAPAHRLLCEAAQLMACSFHKCRWSAVPRPRASLLIT